MSKPAHKQYGSLAEEVSALREEVAELRSLILQPDGEGKAKAKPAAGGKKASKPNTAK